MEEEGEGGASYVVASEVNILKQPACDEREEMCRERHTSRIATQPSHVTAYMPRPLQYMRTI